MMNYTMIMIPALGLVYSSGVFAAEETARPTTEAPPISERVVVNSDEDKVNYSLGFELGKELKQQQLRLIPEALLQGAEDAISGSKPLVKPTQRAAALKQIKEMRAQANLEQSRAFLARIADKEGMVMLPSGLQYRELRAGAGKSPGPDDSVVVNYRGHLIDGTEFDSSYERGKPAGFRLKKVIRGWREALQLMKEGARWELFIPPELAYGKRGLRERIPPNSALVYEVELIAVK